MNRFAHSIDKTFTDVDLNQTIELFVALTERFAAMRGITVDLHLTANPVIITTAPFFLIDLLWLCLDFCISASGDDKQVVLVVEETENIVRIEFQKLAGLTKELSDRFPSDREENLLGMLKADLSIDAGCQEIILQLPVVFIQE
jgi:hypothetical protein